MHVKFVTGTHDCLTTDLQGSSNCSYRLARVKATKHIRYLVGV